jgi:hypothetical protein
VSVSTGWLFWNWNIMAHPLLGDKDSTSPFRRWVKAPQILGEAA